MSKNNMLSGLRCYLAGPIEYSDSEQKNFFDHSDLENFLVSLNVKTLNPRKISFEGISEIQDRKKFFENEDFEEIRRQMKIIVRKDLRSVDISDFVIAYLPKDVKTTGTIHEIIEGDKQQKPVLILCPEGIKHIPSWFFGILPIRYFFDSIENLKDYLKKIAYDQEFRSKDDHWQFIISSLSTNKINF
jgi:nucleoside 2-deoxyribosyltransferase